MGKQISSLCPQLQPQWKYVLVVGLEGSGKTTFLYGPRLKPGWEQAKYESTLGYNYEEIRFSSGILAVFDTPGKDALFPIVKNLYKNLAISGLIFVFKLSNRAIDFITAKRKLKFLANEPELKGCVLVIIGNNSIGNVSVGNDAAGNVRVEVESQFKDPAYLENALGLEDFKHNDLRKLFVYDVKYSPKESDTVWRWLSDNIPNDD